MITWKGVLALILFVVSFPVVIYSGGGVIGFVALVLLVVSWIALIWDTQRSDEFWRWLDEQNDRR